MSVNNGRTIINIEITDFESLLKVAEQQSQPQRLLFVFLQSSLSEDSKQEHAQRFHAGQGGELAPVMCVDKALDELTAFDALVAESDNMAQDWQIVLTGCMSGVNGRYPSSEEAEQPLMAMVKTVQHGGDLSKYLAFDRTGTLVQFA